jgi:hypothetical protein
MNIFEFFLKYRYMGKMVGAGAEAEIFDKLEPVLRIRDDFIPDPGSG